MQLLVLTKAFGETIIPSSPFTPGQIVGAPGQVVGSPGLSINGTSPIGISGSVVSQPGVGQLGIGQFGTGQIATGQPGIGGVGLNQNSINAAVQQLRAQGKTDEEIMALLAAQGLGQGQNSGVDASGLPGGFGGLDLNGLDLNGGFDPNQLAQLQQAGVDPNLLNNVNEVLKDPIDTLNESILELIKQRNEKRKNDVQNLAKNAGGDRDGGGGGGRGGSHDGGSPAEALAGLGGALGAAGAAASQANAAKDAAQIKADADVRKAEIEARARVAQGFAQQQAVLAQLAAQRETAMMQQSQETQRTIMKMAVEEQNRRAQERQDNREWSREMAQKEAQLRREMMESQQNFQLQQMIYQATLMQSGLAGQPTGIVTRPRPGYIPVPPPRIGGGTIANPYAAMPGQAAALGKAVPRNPKIRVAKKAAKNLRRVVATKDDTDAIVANDVRSGSTINSRFRVAGRFVSQRHDRPQTRRDVVTERPASDVLHN